MAQTDREALGALYNATGGSIWKHNTHWNTDADLSEWYGIETNQGRVVRLSLGSNNLRGKIPGELGKLAALKELHLYRNNLSGTIPKELGKLIALKELDLRRNNLSGPIPPWLGTLSELRGLRLNDNELRGPIPQELGNLAALEKLNLGFNQLSGHIPGQLGKLSTLERLDLGNNKFDDHPIPPELGNLRELKTLWLHANQLTGPIPKELGALSTLESLRLDTNKLTEIPPEVLELCRGRLIYVLWVRNPWSRPPSTVVELGFESALGWWGDVKRFGEGKSNKLKMVLVGLAEAGKTTIVRHFTKKSVPKQSDRTVGIEITNWRPSDDVPLQISVWDFAGQADYYSSHQLFLTKGALFLLVVDLHAFSKEVQSGVDNFTDPRGRIYWWLEMLHMRVPGAAIALVGSHIDDLEKEGVDADSAGIRLHTVVSNFIQDKAEKASKRHSIPCIDTEAATTMEVDQLRDDEQTFPLGGSSAQRSGSSEFSAEPLVLHDHVFKVSLDPTSVRALREWIVKAAFGRECPREFNFPAVDQTVPKAWIEAYDAMDDLKKKRTSVLWSEAVEEFSTTMSGSLPDAGKVLLRSMQHREAEGGVLLSLADASVPVEADMLHLDPSWLIELVRRLSDHNLVDDDEKKKGTEIQRLRDYAASVDGIRAIDLIKMFSVYRKSGRLNRGFLRYLWVHRELVPAGPPIVLTDAEFESVVSTMKRLLVMYTVSDADILVVPARLPQCGDQRIVDGIVERMEDTVLTNECSFGQVYPPPAVVGRFLAWSAQQVDTYYYCWQRGAFFRYKFQREGFDEGFDVFLCEEPVEEPHMDDSKCMHAGLVLGVEGPRHKAREVLDYLEKSLRNLVEDRVHGYPGIQDSFYFMPDVKERESKSLTRLDSLRVAVGEVKEVLVGFGGMVSQLLEQQLLAASNEESEYPHLVLVRPDLVNEDGETPERFDPAGWRRWMEALSDIRSNKFRLHFLCEHDLSEVPCGPEGRGFLIEQPKKWVKKILPLVQGSLWVVRVAVGAVSHVDLPLNDLLSAFVKATSAELVVGVSKVTENIGSAAVPGFGDEATGDEIRTYKRLRGTAYEALYDFMQGVESPGCLSGCLQCLSGCICCHRKRAVVDWRKNMVQVENPRTRRLAWVLIKNKDEYVRKHGGVIPATRAPPS